MAGVRKKPKQSGKYEGWFVDWRGKRKFFVGTKKKTETLHMAQRLEDEHRQIRLGYRPPPTAADLHSKRDYTDVRDEYLAWGESQGGRGGRAWAPKHTQNRRRHLTWWGKQLGLVYLRDLEGVLPQVEHHLRQMQRAGRTPKTVASYADSLLTFCKWCLQRKYLDENPLAGMARFDDTPQSYRRLATEEELRQILAVAPPHRRLLYEAAFLSGLRANELRQLTVHHLDLENNGVRLDAEWTKNRKPGFQPLPGPLLAQLLCFAESGEPERLYQQHYKSKEARGCRPSIPDNPLLFVPWHTYRVLEKDLKKAGIPKHNPKGKLDFHALRVAYINMVIESGATVKEVQVLARHTAPTITFNTYGRVKPERLAATVEKIAANLYVEEATEAEQKCGLFVADLAVGAEGISVSGLGAKGNGEGMSVGRADAGPALTSLVSSSTLRHKQHKGSQKNHTTAQTAPPNPPTSSHHLTPKIHPEDTLSHKKCGLCVAATNAPIPADLKALIDAWPHIPAKVKDKIQALLAPHLDLGK